VGSRSLICTALCMSHPKIGGLPAVHTHTPLSRLQAGCVCVFLLSVTGQWQWQWAVGSGRSTSHFPYEAPPSGSIIISPPPNPKPICLAHLHREKTTRSSNLCIIAPPPLYPPTVLPSQARCGLVVADQHSVPLYSNKAMHGTG
jgi:hypothetical protein